VIKNILIENGYDIVRVAMRCRKPTNKEMVIYDRPEVAGKIGGVCGADFVLMA